MAILKIQRWSTVVVRSPSESTSHSRITDKNALGHWWYAVESIHTQSQSLPRPHHQSELKSSSYYILSKMIFRILPLVDSSAFPR